MSFEELSSPESELLDNSLSEVSINEDTKIDKKWNIDLWDNSKYNIRQLHSSGVNYGFIILPLYNDNILNYVQLRGKDSKELLELNSNDWINLVTSDCRLDPFQVYKTILIDESNKYDIEKDLNLSLNLNMIVKIITMDGSIILLNPNQMCMTKDKIIFANELNTSHLLGSVHQRKYIPKSNDINSQIILDENIILQNLNNYNYKTKSTHITELKNNGWLPLYSNDWRIPILAGMIGYEETDGTANIYNEKISVRWIFGSIEDVKDFNNDLVWLGINPASYYKNVNKRKNFKNDKISAETTFQVHKSDYFATLILSLGISIGRRVTQENKGILNWIKNGTLETQINYISGFEGGDGSRKYMISDGDRWRLNMNCITQTKITTHVNSLILFFNEYKLILNKFNITTTEKDICIKEKYFINENERTQIGLQYSCSEKNLILHNDTFEYKYCLEKQQTSYYPMLFIKAKNLLLNPKQIFREQIIEKAKELRPIIVRQMIEEDINKSIQFDMEIRINKYMKDMNLIKTRDQKIYRTIRENYKTFYENNYNYFYNYFYPTIYQELNDLNNHKVKVRLHQTICNNYKNKYTDKEYKCIRTLIHHTIIRGDRESVIATNEFNYNKWKKEIPFLMKKSLCEERSFEHSVVKWCPIKSIEYIENKNKSILLIIDLSKNNSNNSSNSSNSISSNLIVNDKPFIIINGLSLKLI